MVLWCPTLSLGLECLLGLAGSLKFLETNIVSIKSAQIHNVTLKQDQVNITVEYVTDQIKSTRNTNDEVVDGDPDTIETVTDLWTFNRNIKSNNPNWTLVKTETPGDSN